MYLLQDKYNRQNLQSNKKKINTNKIIAWAPNLNMYSYLFITHSCSINIFKISYYIIDYISIIRIYNEMRIGKKFSKEKKKKKQLL